MNRILYYVVEKQIQDVDTFEEITGNKTITIYEIVLDTPKVWFDVETTNDNDSEKEIQKWLNDNGFAERDYTFFKL